MSTFERDSQVLWIHVLVWKKLSHENILPFRGVNMTIFQLALVYDWGQNGNISQYVAMHPDASRPLLVWKSLIIVANRQINDSISQLFGVAKGLEYLHSLDIPHGDLKGVGGFPASGYILAAAAPRPPFLFGRQLYFVADSVATGKCCRRSERPRSFDGVRASTRQL